MRDEKHTVIYGRGAIEREVCSSFQSSMDKLESFWKEFGINEEQVAERSKAVLEHVTTLLQELVKEEEELCNSIRNRVKSHTKELEQICSELDIQPNKPDEYLPLLQKDKFLRTQLDDVTTRKQVRMEKYKHLLKTEGHLCDMLGMPKTDQLSSVVPKEQELHELEQHVHMLSDERERRYHKYCSAKKQLSTILEETDFSPETSFEREVICYDEDDDFILSQEKLDQLKKVVEKVQHFRQEMVAEIKNLLEKMNALWNSLNVDVKIREEFKANHSEIRRSTVSAMKREIERCEEIRKKNIRHYTDKLREEIVNLWEKCFISNRERHAFEPFYSEDYTEELLQLHDQEVDKLKNYYAETKEIFQKIAKRQELWDMMLVFEKKACDPNRFTNRGGLLLQEEKRRNRLLKELPRLEDEILEDISVYEEKNDTLFLVNGINFSEFIKNKWEEHQREKENEKLERQKQRSIMMDSGPVRTPCKRPLFCTPASAPGKMIRTNATLSASSRPMKQCLTPKQPTFYGTSQSCKKPMTSARRRSPRFTPLSKGVLVEKNSQHMKHSAPSSSNDTTSYTDFARELDKDCRDRCRSSVVAGKRRVLGSKINHSGSLKKNRSSFNSASNRSHSGSNTLLRSNKSVRNTSRTPTKLTPARGKLGLPFLI